MCFSSGNQTTQTANTTPPKFIRQAQQNVINTAQEAAAAPFAQPAQPVAPFTPYQTQAFNQVAALQGMTDPYYAQAREAVGEAGTPVTQEDIQRYLNPYADAALGNMNKYIFGPQRVQTMGQARARAGGTGADRLALTQQNLDFTQADALSQALAGFYSPAIAQAQRAKEMALASGSAWANLGQGAQSAALQATGALGTAGGQQQQQAQAELMSPYQQELARLAYPFQTTQFLSGVTAQQAPGAGGTTTQTTTYPTPSVGNQIVGLGTSALGAYMGMPSGGIGKGSTPNYGQSYNIGYGGQMMPVFGFPSNRGGRTYARGGSVEDTQNWISEGFRMARDAIHGEDHMDMGGVPSWPPYMPNPGSIQPPMMPQPGMTGMGLPPSGWMPHDPRRAGAIGWGTKHYTGNMTSPMMGGRGFGPNADGGQVNPFHMGEGFDFGGPVIDADYTDDTSPPAFADRWRGDVLSSRTPNENVESRFGQGQAGSFADPQAIKPLINQGNARFQELQQGPTIPPELHGRVYDNAPPPPVEAPPGPIERPQVTVGPPPGRQPAPAVEPPSDPSIDLRRLMMPREAMPYPDALNRDWGQKVVRSPWMALVDAGAKIAQTTGPIGSAIGAGIQAGTKTLEGQRKALTAEEAINQRASALYQHAKAELDRYSKMTPYQKESLKQSRFQQMPYTTGEGHPVVLESKSGQTYNAITGEKIGSGVPLNQRTAANRQPALVATAEWMVKNGIAADRASAFDRLKQGASDQARFSSLVKEYVRIIMQADPTMDLSEARRKAERMARGEEFPE